MHLVSEDNQWVNFESLNRRFFFVRDEALHTENSYKLSTQQAEKLLEEAGFPAVAAWFDPEQWYGLFLGRKSA